VNVIARGPVKPAKSDRARVLDRWFWAGLAFLTVPAYFAGQSTIGLGLPPVALVGVWAVFVVLLLGWGWLLGRGRR
jgi:hypothetical protein